MSAEAASPLLVKRHHRQQATLHADRGALRFCRNHPLARIFCTARNLRFLRARIAWTKRELAETRAALDPHRQTPPHYQQWLCIHAHEGAWDDAGGPYYGGLQMDIGFQEAYGLALYRAKGTADHWTPLEQMWVAEKAYESRGFSPWPNTAAMCGLG